MLPKIRLGARLGTVYCTGVPHGKPSRRTAKQIRISRRQPLRVRKARESPVAGGVLGGPAVSRSDATLAVSIRGTAAAPPRIESRLAHLIQSAFVSPKVLQSQMCFANSFVSS